ncbi:hypothetical protein KSP40_PGU002676 [Platanthera guangdongensis]|uniref:Uncharacterized protein n=1 Tax=Platanthera guangdongensis TaxID=2320717 RepID=A0ABR2LTR9_9ASPA
MRVVVAPRQGEGGVANHLAWRSKTPLAGCLGLLAVILDGNNGGGGLSEVATYDFYHKSDVRLLDSNASGWKGLGEPGNWVTEAANSKQQLTSDCLGCRAAAWTMLGGCLVDKSMLFGGRILETASRELIPAGRAYGSSEEETESTKRRCAKQEQLLGRRRERLRAVKPCIRVVAVSQGSSPSGAAWVTMREATTGEKVLRHCHPPLRQLSDHRDGGHDRQESYCQEHSQQG